MRIAIIRTNDKQGLFIKFIWLLVESVRLIK
jgi:hypothetical protein